MAKEPHHIDVQEGYDRWAEIYDDDGNPLIFIEEPVVRRWFATPRGLRIADVGCGTGRHTLWLADAGAQVDAFDTSCGMLARARAKFDDGGVRFIHHALPAPLPADDNTYDAVLFALVADHMAELVHTLRELLRVTRPGGFGVMTVIHPAMNLKGITARFTDPADGREVRVAAFEHSFADYVMGLLHAGWIIEDIIEKKADEALVTQTRRAEKYLGWPLLLAIKVRKGQCP